MSFPEFTEPNPELGNLAFPSDLRPLEQIENNDFNQAFADLREEILRVELLGEDDRTRRSLHTQYVDGNKRLVYFYAASYFGVGRTYRTIVNTLTNIEDVGTYIAIEDILVAHSKDAVTVQGTEFWRYSDGSKKSDYSNAGPVLRRGIDSLQILRGSNYGLVLPEKQETDPMEIRILRRGTAAYLTDLLKTLNDISIEPATSEAEEKWV